MTDRANCILYADDTCILIAEPDMRTALTTASLCFGLYSIWFCNNMLALNAKKSNCMFFNCQRNLPDVIKFDVHTVQRTDCVKFLGYFIDSKFKWDKHVQFVTDKLAKCIGMLRLCKFLPQSCLLSMYNAYALPYLTNGIEYWGVCAKSLIDPLLVLQKCCIRLIVKAHRVAHCAPIAKFCNILFINDLFDYNTVCFMYKVYTRQCCDNVLYSYQWSGSSHSISTRFANLNFYVHRCNSNIRKYFIKIRGCVTWNNLPITVRLSNSLTIFKHNMRKLLFNNYI